MCLKQACYLIINAAFVLVFVTCSKNKRSLLYPGPIAKVQGIMGAGFPIDLEDESALIGIVIKSHYFLPRNSSDYTNADIIYAKGRRKRSMDDNSRWDFYRLLISFSELYGFGSKECVLRAICQLAEIPFDRNAGLFEELFHIAFTPTTTNDIIQSQTDNEYYAAQKVGKANKVNCRAHFPGCTVSFVDMFTALENSST